MYWAIQTFLQWLPAVVLIVLSAVVPGAAFPKEKRAGGYVALISTMTISSGVAVSRIPAAPKLHKARLEIKNLREIF